MDLNNLVLSANLLQGSIVFITLFANVPQWITIYKNQSSANISLSSFCLWLTASAFGLYYAIINQYAFGNCSALLLSAFISFTCNLYTIHLILKFKEKESERTAQPTREPTTNIISWRNEYEQELPDSYLPLSTPDLYPNHLFQEQIL